MAITNNYARELDQFFTNSDVAKDCISFLKSEVSIKNAFYVEPSAGAGAFFNQLPLKSRLGLDLLPQHNLVKQQDFLLFDSAALPKKRKVIVIGNPPFGKNSTLAIKFINKAAEFAEVIGFILPKTFRKQSVINKLDRYLHLQAEFELQSHSFNFQGMPYDVPCVFQVWVKLGNERDLIVTPTGHPDFRFVAPAQADFAIRRVGAFAGKVLDDLDRYSQASNYFIGANQNSLDCRHIFETIDWSPVKYNTAGNPSVSKRELVQLYSQAKTHKHTPIYVY